MPLHSIWVRSTSGAMVDLSSLDTYRMTWRGRRYTASGSVTLNSDILDGAFWFAEANDSGVPPTLSRSGNVLEWNAWTTDGIDPSTDITIIVMV